MRSIDSKSLTVQAFTLKPSSWASFTLFLLKSAKLGWIATAFIVFANLIDAFTLALVNTPKGIFLSKL